MTPLVIILILVLTLSCLFNVIIFVLCFCVKCSGRGGNLRTTLYEDFVYKMLNSSNNIIIPIPPVMENPITYNDRSFESAHSLVVPPIASSQRGGLRSSIRSLEAYGSDENNKPISMGQTGRRRSRSFS